MSATHAAIIFALEPVFAALLAAWLFRRSCARGAAAVLGARLVSRSGIVVVGADGLAQAPASQSSGNVSVYCQGPRPTTIKGRAAVVAREDLVDVLGVADLRAVQREHGVARLEARAGAAAPFGSTIVMRSPRRPGRTEMPRSSRSSRMP